MQYEFWPCIQTIEYLYARIKLLVFTVCELHLLSGYCLCHKRLIEASGLDNKETDLSIDNRDCV